MQIIPAFVTQNKCYQAGAPLTPRGIMLHSVGTCLLYTSDAADE